MPGVYSQCMDRLSPALDQSVEEVLQEWPGAAEAFQTLRTACLGCILARFCNLSEVAATYGIAPQTLMDQLRQAVHDTHSQPRSKR